jgi:hypothetical protein
MWFSPSMGDKLTNLTPFATVALAGHSVGGNWCQCGSPGCMCDPGELGLGAHAVSDASPVQNSGKAKPSRGSDLDFGTGAFLIGLALLMWSRLRA